MQSVELQQKRSVKLLAYPMTLKSVTSLFMEMEGVRSEHNKLTKGYGTCYGSTMRFVLWAKSEFYYYKWNMKSRDRSEKLKPKHL